MIFTEESISWPLVQAMIVVGRHRLVALMDKHPDVRPWIAAWEKEVRKANWAGPQDIKNRYRAASMLADNVVIFNVKGNSFRLQVRVSYQCGVAAIERCGTHAEYDRWK